MCAVALHIGARGSLQSVFVRHSTHAPVAVLHTVSRPAPVQFVLDRHSTQRMVVVSQ
jgi:hypothetical protein